MTFRRTLARTVLPKLFLLAFAFVAFAPVTNAHASASEPTTAAGYARLWVQLSRGDEWGGGDVSLSVPLADGRVVWLYGDTFSRRNGMVRSSAIVQTGGELHVSNHGAQVLPNDRPRAGRQHIYWIEAARQVGRRALDVTAGPMSVGTANGWDFQRRDARSRVARARVTEAGDVRFVRWKGWTAAPAPLSDLAELGGGHVTYEHRAHPWARLAGGGTLMTHANNWVLGGDWKRTRSGEIDYAAYAPTFYAVGS